MVYNNLLSPFIICNFLHIIISFIFLNSFITIMPFVIGQLMIEVLTEVRRSRFLMYIEELVVKITNHFVISNFDICLFFDLIHFS